MTTAPPVLIDEIDRADDEFEAFPVGDPLRLPDHDPGDRHDPRPSRRWSIITSNRTRARRPQAPLLYHWIDTRLRHRVRGIVRLKVPGIQGPQPPDRRCSRNCAGPTS